MPASPNKPIPNSRLIIGLMSGTSVDAIDAALVEINRSPGWKSGAFAPAYTARVLHHHEHPWPRALRQRLLDTMAPASTTTQEICQLNFLVSQEFANATHVLLKSARLKKQNISALASHGQTVCHLPPANPKRKTRFAQPGSTLQLGDISVLATLTGIRTVGNFRTADMALGGQGAPLVPWTDAILLTDKIKTRAVQNIGGIANLTYLPKESPGWKSGAFAPEAQRRILAFDTGPGNMAIDALISLATHGKQRYDINGRLAARGALDPTLFRRLQKHPYFSRKPPKSTGREDFGTYFVAELLATIGNGQLAIGNLLHTLTRLTAWSIADAYRRFLPTLPDEVILCGGGTENPVLVGMLHEELGPRIALRRIDDFGIPNKAKEAASFALLGAATLDGIPGNLPSVTGASRPTVLGVIANSGRP